MSESNTIERVENYLDSTIQTFKLGQDEYYNRWALEQAYIAHQEGNYGIGAIAVMVTAGEISEYPAHNAMITGLGVVDHAETRAIIKAKQGREPAISYARNTNEYTKSLQEGLHVHGTLEACPMCACAMINAGAIRSVSTVLDGDMIQKDGLNISSGGANSIGEKGKLQPQVWQWIQEGIGLSFVLLATEDKELVELSGRIFEDYREEIDAQLAARGTGKA